jgi:16S rRNA C967 or C1407 C5-methylase (RsmB/RsmF family)
VKRFRRLSALTLALASSACHREAASAAPPPAAAAMEPAQDAGKSARPAPRVPAQPLGWQSAGWLIRPEREAQEQPERMLDALHLKQGDTVADVGAGVGYHAWRIATRVGPKGTVYATDLQPEMLELLREAMRLRGVKNVIPVQATAHSTGLPEGQLDVALLVDVYTR